MAVFDRFVAKCSKAIQLLSPLNVIYNEKSNKSEFEFTYTGSDINLEIEGLVASYRELRAVVVNLEQASILPVTGYNIALAKIQGPLYKFKASVPILERYNEIEIRVFDISGLTSAMKLKVTRTVEVAYKFKPEIRIILPQEMAFSDTLKVSGIETLHIAGVINSEFPVKSVFLNNSPVPFVELTAEEKANYNYRVRKNSVKFSTEHVLEAGLNKIEVISIDNLNNTASKTLTIFASKMISFMIQLHPRSNF